MRQASQQCSSIDEVRAQIDRIDREIVALLAERGLYMKQAAQFKKTSDDEKAPQRVEQVLMKVKTMALEQGANQIITEQVYRAMIAAFIEVELAEYAAGRELHFELVEKSSIYPEI